MFRKAMIATLAVAFVAVATVSATTPASAKNNRHRNAAIAAGVLGLSAVIIGSAVANERRRARAYHGYHGGPVYHGGYYRAPRQCWDEPVTRWSNYYGDYVVVGYDRVCN